MSFHGIAHRYRSLVSTLLVVTKEEIEAFAERLCSISAEIDGLDSVEDRAQVSQLVTDALGVASVRVAASRQKAVRGLRSELGWSHSRVGEFLTQFLPQGAKPIGKGMASRIANTKLKRD